MVDFNFTYQRGMSVQQMLGMEMAGRIWGKVLTDNVTVNIHVATATDMPGTALAGALPAFAKTELSDYFEHLQADMTSVDDSIMLQSTQPQYLDGKLVGWFDLYLSDRRSSSRNLGHISKEDDDMNLSRANGKAINLLDSNNSELDAFIAFNDLASSTISWSYNFVRDTGNDPNSVDFLSVALHEIGHALGFISSIDRPGWLSSDFSKVTPEEMTARMDEYLNSIRERAKLMTPLDLTRYSTESSFVNDLSIGGVAFFKTSRWDWSQNKSAPRFATGKLLGEGGDGWQASHWNQANGQTLMKPGLSLGEQAFIALEDLLALDVIGWNRGSNPTSLDLATIFSEAKQALANRIGVTTDWLDQHATAAAARLSQDMMDEVLQMAADSEYEGRRNSRTRSWQELVDILTQEGLFESFGMDLAQSPRQNRNRDVRKLVNGSDQADELLGSRYHEQLVGKSGDDTIHGGNGHDNLWGGAGDDVLVGDRGIDVLYGGDGADTFVIQSVGGPDYVKDFTPGEDTLGLASDLKRSQLEMTQEGSHVAISDESNTLMVLLNTDISSLS
jgi:hypothetical protein